MSTEAILTSAKEVEFQTRLESELTKMQAEFDRREEQLKSDLENLRREADQQRDEDIRQLKLCKLKA
nr:hypothetical protein BaRGS_005228 [Batillaria attramentaria]